MTNRETVPTIKHFIYFYKNKGKFWIKCDINDIVLEEIKPIHNNISLYDMELDLLSDNDLDETENVFIPNKILAHQFRDCIEDDYDFITDDEINIDDIYEMNYDIIIKNFQNNISNDYDNIDNNIFSDNNTLNKTNQNSDNISKFVSLNEKNFSIDHIIKNTYGRSENLNMLTQTNELFELLIEEENTVRPRRMY
uniref:Autophagy-related protein 7 n=1 Tax=Strongyloides venezuelensis TaxID=75913 RepID=A0A0K0FT46_STRVS